MWTEGRTDSKTDRQKDKRKNFANARKNVCIDAIRVFGIPTLASVSLYKLEPHLCTGFN
jgi:hypothetical protein